MNNKAFTLVELLAVIAILSVLVLLVLPNITNSVNNHSNKTDKLVLSMIKDAAKLYVEDNKKKFEENPYDYSCITLTELVDKEYLKKGIEMSGEDITNTKSIKVTNNDGFNYELVNNSECILIPDPGLYDKNNKLLASWDELVEEYDFKTLIEVGGISEESSDSGVATYIINTHFSNATKLIIDKSVTNIGDEAFYNCTNLKSITIPNSVTGIGASAFWNCRSLTSITISEGVTSIGEYAFEACTSLTSITIPGSVTSIGDYSFWGCINLKDVTIAEGVTSIGAGAFQECNNLMNIAIPSSVVSIGNWAFTRCHSLTSIIIPASVTSIGENAFLDCDSLATIHYKGIATGYPWGAPNATVVSE